MSAGNKQETLENNWWSDSPTSQSNVGTGLAGTTEILNSGGQDSTEALAEEWLASKANLRKAQARLDKAMNALVQNCGVREDGSQSQCVGGYKIITTGTINYNIDEEGAERLLSEGILNAALWHEIFTVKTGLRLSKAAYQETITAMPELAQAIQECLTSTKGKDAVTVKRIED